MQVPAYYEPEIAENMTIDYEKYDYAEDIHSDVDIHKSESEFEKDSKPDMIDFEAQIKK